MTSLARKLNRRFQKDGNPQYTVQNEDGGYTTLHPTKGWQRVSGSRIRAQQTMMEKYGFIR